MIPTYIIPQWFFGFDIALEILFSIFIIFVGIYSIRIYNLSGQRQSKLFGLGFLIIAAAYISKALVNIIILAEVKKNFLGLTLENLDFIGRFGLYSYLFLFIIGLVTLAYMTFKIDNPRVYTLLLATNVLIIFLSANRSVAFNLLSSLLLFYICAHYIIEYQKSKNQKTLLVLVAFIGLFIIGLGFAFAPDFYGNYVISHFIELCSYLLILASLLLAIRKK